MSETRRIPFARCIAVAMLAGALAACAVAPPRTDDPLQGFNRKVFAFNQFADKVAIKPTAQAYVAVTPPEVRVHVTNFFTNLRTPITIFNEALQGRPGPALDSVARFLINTTAGIFGIFDPATRLDVPLHSTDFGVTLADWGVPDGPYLVLPFFGPTTVRDMWRYPVDSYADPLAWYAREHDLAYGAQYLPGLVYLVNLRASLLPYDNLLDSAYDPYAFMRDAYRQRRLNMIYHGNPPLSAIEQLQGTTPTEESDQDIDKLLEQQRQYEKTHGGSGLPTPATSTPPPAEIKPPTGSG